MQGHCNGDELREILRRRCTPGRSRPGYFTNGRPPPFAVAATLAFVVDASLTAVNLISTFPSASIKIYTLLLALCSGGIGWYGADLARAAAGAPHARRTKPLAPSTVWPSDLHVESISPSAPVPPTFVCPITMAPMANPAMTPRGTTYDREALSAWITKHHRYPGGEARAATAQTSERSSGAAPRRPP